MSKGQVPSKMGFDAWRPLGWHWEHWLMPSDCCCDIGTAGRSGKTLRGEALSHLLARTRSDSQGPKPEAPSPVATAQGETAVHEAACPTLETLSPQAGGAPISSQTAARPPWWCVAQEKIEHHSFKEMECSVIFCDFDL